VTARRKKFEQARAPENFLALTEGATIDLPRNASTMRRIDLGSWLGKGFDDWVLTCAAQLRAIVGQTAPSSVVTYAKALRYFFEYLADSHTAPRIADFAAVHGAGFVAWLRRNNGVGDVTRRGVFTSVRTVLLGLQDRGVIDRAADLFPRNPFPMTARQKKGDAPLSQSERSRLAEALRSDVIALANSRFSGTEGEALTVYALALAMRTGLNTTPLLELKRDCLQPHPFMPRMRLLKAFKRRGNATHIKALRFHRIQDVPTSVPLDGVAIFEEVLRRTDALVPSAAPDVRDRVWLYRSEARRNAGRVCCMTESLLNYNSRKVVARHALLADDGSPLPLNLSRLRKTMENRLWRLSNGDLFTVAAIMGHRPEVADQSYLRVSDEMRRDAVFVGEALPEIFRNAGRTRRSLEATPVGNCADTLHGHRAPGNGTRCTDFLSCFGCRSFVIVGSESDLRRLFSFYWFLEAEGRTTRSREWAEHFLALRTQIDTFTLDRFDENVVEAAKEAARLQPLKFWSQYKRLGGKPNASN
jgi:integrase